MFQMPSSCLLKNITLYYIESSDLNGIPFQELASGKDPEPIGTELASLVMAGLAVIVFGDRHPNSHIRALAEHHTTERQVELLGTAQVLQACIYPTRKHLETIIDRRHYDGSPYSLELALGTPQLEHVAFDLSALEPYRNDPRYNYDSDDIFGDLSARSDASLKEGDDIHLRFGFAYDEGLNKYVAAFVRDLANLSPKHQTLWKMKEMALQANLHPDYHRAALGEWPERVSIYHALIEELQVINDMARAMGRPPLFREDYREKSRPREFASLLRPTAREYEYFVHLLDKLMSENISKKFLGQDVADHDKIPHEDGTFERRMHGTMKILEEWIKQRFRPRDSKPMDEMFSTFRKVRKLRQVPAHTANDNVFDQKFIHTQRDLMLSPYNALRTLRLVLANHPDSKTVEIPDFLFKEEIWPR
jgi:hypothetical protein